MTPGRTEEIDGDLHAVADTLRRVTVVVHADDRGNRRADDARGAGILWSVDGTVVTNAHVATADAASLTLADGRTVRARVAARDLRRDLALLRAELPPGGAGEAATVGTPAALRTGELVMALGHPRGVENGLAVGVVHAAPSGTRSPYVVADIRLAPGNSGGPLADAHGRIVGVNSMIVGGLGIAISTDVVTRFVAAATPRPLLGVELRPVQVRSTSGDRATAPALLVLRTDPSGAAAHAGIGQGDVLLGHAGHPLASPAELMAIVSAAGPGGLLRLEVGRGGRRLTVDVHLPALTDATRRAA